MSLHYQQSFVLSLSPPLLCLSMWRQPFHQRANSNHNTDSELVLSKATYSNSLHTSIQLLSKFRVCILWRSIWRPITSHEVCPKPKAPPNAAHKCSFFSLFLEDAPLRSFVASHIPRFFAHPKKKKEREKMATFGWRRSSLSRAWAAEIVT